MIKQFAVAALLVTSACVEAEPVADSPRVEPSRRAVVEVPRPATPHDPSAVGPSQPENVRSEVRQ